MPRQSRSRWYLIVGQSRVTAASVWAILSVDWTGSKQMSAIVFLYACPQDLSQSLVICQLVKMLNYDELYKLAQNKLTNWPC